MRRPPRFLVALLALAPAGLTAEVTPHPTQAGRLVETRGDLAVEYSPGQEAWAEMAFARLQTLIAERAAAPTPPPLVADPTQTGSAAHVRAQRQVLLAAVAAHIGLEGPTDLQQRTFDTFLGYYDLLNELHLLSAARVPELLRPRQVGIWHFDDLKQRLAAGDKIPGMTYDSATDTGGYNISGQLMDTDLTNRIQAVKTEIRSQQVKHSFSQNADRVSASFSLRPPDAPGPPDADGSDQSMEAFNPDQIVLPVVYRGDFAQAPDPAAFGSLDILAPGTVTTLRDRAAAYRDPRTVFVILHETIESGLLDAVIRSPDRRWLCDGTANYVAQRIMADTFDPEFAQQGYDLSGQLRRYAHLQPRIDLVAWSASEYQDDDSKAAELNAAHYAFATRAVALLVEQYGDEALAHLWRDTAAVGPTAATAKTFATALRKRYRGDLGKIIRTAEASPPPPAPVEP